jgi:hypothetical protein
MKIILFTVMLILTYGCQSNQYVEIIYPFAKSKNRHDIKALVKEIIPLETSSTSMVGLITKARFIKDRILVFDFLHGRTVSCFSKEGKLLYKIPIGKGYGEANSISDFTVFENILFIRCPNYILLYNVEDGKFIKQVMDDSSVFFTQFELLNSGLILGFGYAPPIVNSENEMEYIQDLEDIITYRTAIIENNQIKAGHYFLDANPDFIQIIPSNPISVYNSNVLCIYPPFPEIYQFADGEMKLKYKIDYGKYSFKKIELKSNSAIYAKAIRSGERIGFEDNLLETEYFIIFSYVKEIGKRTFCLYSKKSNSSYSIDEILNNIGLPYLTVASVIGDNTLLCIMDPSLLNENDLRDFNNLYHNLNITFMSNSIVLLIKIEEHV